MFCKMYNSLVCLGNSEDFLFMKHFSLALLHLVKIRNVTNEFAGKV